MSVKGKYFDGKRPVSIAVSCEISDGLLVIYNLETGTRFPGWSVEDLTQDLDQNTALVLLNKATGERLELDEVPPGLPEHLYRRKKVSSRPLQLGALVAGVAVVLALLWIALPHLSRGVASLISEEKEKAWASGLNLNEIEGLKTCLPSEASRAAWQKLLTRIWPLYPNERPEDLQIEIVSGDIENAFNLPGGKIIVLDKLVKNASSPEELAGTLAHEIAHARERHVLQKIISALSLAAVFQFIGGDFSSAFAIDPATLLSIASLSFDRGMERKADELARQRLLAANVDPRDMANLFLRSGKNSGMVAFFTTHPADEERVSFFKSVPVRDYGKVLNQREWEAVQNYCEVVEI